MSRLPSIRLVSLGALVAVIALSACSNSPTAPLEQTVHQDQRAADDSAAARFGWRGGP